MDKWLIAADSSCDLPSAEFGRKVPFIISAGERDFIDTEELDTSAMLEYIEACKDAAHTSCPAPGAWLRLFEQAENTVAVTISRKLSGSYASAAAAREVFLEQHPDRNVLLINSRSTGPALSMIVHRARELVDSGADFELISSELSDYALGLHTVFALSSFDNLIKNGRMSRIAGFVAGKLGIWGVGAGSREGEIVVKKKLRGAEKMLREITDDMAEAGFCGGEVYISHCHNPGHAQQLKDRIERLWRDARVRTIPTRGLCSYYAERRGLILTY